MKEINCSEYDLIYLDEEDEIEAFRRLQTKDVDDDSENFDKILEYSEDSHSNSKDQRRQYAQEALAQKQLMGQIMDERDEAFSDDATETHESRFGDGYEAFRKSAVNNGRRSTIIAPTKESRTTDPFQKEQADDETYTESKGVIPPDIEVSKSSYEDREESRESSVVNNRVYARESEV